MTDLETRLTERYSKELKAAAGEVKSKLGEEVAGLNERIDTEVEAITLAYTAAISTVRGELDNGGART